MRRAVAVLCAVGLVLGMLASRAPASAAGFSSTFWAIACDRDPGVVQTRDAHFPPEGCRMVSGVEYQLFTVDGTLYWTCRTDASGWCDERIDLAGRWVLQAVEGTFPDGLVPQQRVQLFEAQASMTGIAFVPPESLAAPADGGARLTVHARECPMAYASDDWYGDCHGTPPGYPQAISLWGPTARGAWVDGEGTAVFAGLPAGRWTAVPALPKTSAQTYSFCARADQPGIALPVEIDGSVVRLDLATGDDVICDLYAVPGTLPEASASLTFHMRICKEMVPPAEIYAACHERGYANGWIDVFDTVTRKPVFGGHLDGEGNITLRVPPGAYWAMSVPGHWVKAEYVYCSQDGIDGTGIEEFPVISAGEAWTCDVYVATQPSSP